MTMITRALYELMRLSMGARAPDMAQMYQEGRPQADVPECAVAMAQVVIFEDGSVHVSGPPALLSDEAELAGCLRAGLGILGYDVEIIEGDVEGVEVTGIHNPLSPTGTPATA